MTVTSGSPTQIHTAVTTSAEVSALDDTALASGDMASTSLGGLAMWVLDKASVAAPGVSTLVTKSGQGRWVQQPTGVNPIFQTIRFTSDIRFEPDTGVHLQHSLTGGAPGMAFVSTVDAQALEVWSNPAAATSTVDPFVVYAKYLGNLGVIFDVSAPGFLETCGVSFASGIRGSGFPNGGGDGSIVEPNLGTMTLTSGAQSDGNFAFVTLPVGTAGKHPQTTWKNGTAGITYMEIIPAVNVTFVRVPSGQLYLSAYGGGGNDFVQLDCNGQPVFIGGSASAVSLRPGGTDVFKATAAACAWFNAVPVARQGSAPAAIDLPTVLTLANALRTALLNYNLIG